jgi:glycosyltransferase involved in cell wall biosynthesis
MAGWGAAAAQSPGRSSSVTTGPAASRADLCESEGELITHGSFPGAPSPRVSVVVPALNEARNLPHVFSRLPRGLHEVIIVDGHSVDHTIDVARRLRPDVRIITQGRSGKGNALACGFAAATGDIIAMIDADGSADPAEIPQFVKALLDGADFAKGSRFVAGGGSSDITRLRRLGNWLLCCVVNVLCSTQYSDLCYGYNAFWRNHVPVFGLDAESAAPAGSGRLWGDGFEVETLINIRIAQAGLTVTEVPSYEHERIHGVSNLNAFSDGLRVLRSILTERYYSRNRAGRARACTARATSKAPVARDGSHRKPAPSGVRGRHNAQATVAGNADGRHDVRERVVVVGSGLHFASGISHYSYLLTSTLASEYDAGALLMRRLVPERFYPGRAHVGAAVAGSVAYSPEVSVYDGVDWYWGRSMTGALAYLDEQRPAVVIFEWWTGAVLHTYLRLARHAARLGARIILEWHEGQDVGEAAMPLAHHYVRALMPRLLSHVDAHVVHSDFDLKTIPAAYPLGDAIVRVMPHGPYHHVISSTAACADIPEDAPFRLLYFGVIRPYKGVEDLVEAFSLLDREQASQFRLSVVGETWQGCTAPDLAIARSPHADLIERVDRYVSDEELADHVAQADAIVLPYHRASLSGPLFIAMTAGLPTVVTAVGGLVEVVEDYAGAVLVPPQNPAALRDALLKLPARRGERYPNPRSWQQTLAGYRALIGELLGRNGGDPALSAQAAQQAGCS